MPAIQLARLKMQIDQLAGSFKEPATFVGALHHILHYYADRTIRQGQAGEPSPLMLAYKVPTQVLRQLNQELARQAAADPPAALALADALWQENNLECRLTAAKLLGMVPAATPQPVIERASAWVQSAELSLVDSVFVHGLVRVRKEAAESYLDLVKNWLNSKSQAEVRLGLHASAALAGDPDFENLPIVFRLVTPLARSVPANLRPDLVDVLAALVRRSPQEAAHFFNQNKGYEPVAWLGRQVLGVFPPKMQPGVRASLRGS